MQPSTKSKHCFIPKGNPKILLCNVVDLHSNGQLWETKSGKWIPVPIEENTPVNASVPSVEKI